MSRHEAPRRRFRGWFGHGRTRPCSAWASWPRWGSTPYFRLLDRRGDDHRWRDQLREPRPTAGPSTGSEFLTGTGPNNWTYST